MSAAENLDLLADIIASLARVVKAGVETRHLRDIRQRIAYLEGLGPAERADVAPIEAAAREALREIDHGPATGESD